MLDPRTSSKRFDLSMCNMLMCFTFHYQNIRMSKKERDFNSTCVIKRIAPKILIRNTLSSEGAKR